MAGIEWPKVGLAGYFHNFIIFSYSESYSHLSLRELVNVPTLPKEKV